MAEQSHWLERRLTTICYGWRLERSDGFTIGFVSHDADIIRGGLLYRSSPGMVPSAISKSSGFDVDSLDVEGALSDDAINSADLFAGRWDGARVKIYMFDWEDAGVDAVELATGELGEISQSGDGFRAELRGLTALLDVAVAPETSPTCRADLGDSSCSISLNRFKLDTVVSSLVGGLANGDANSAVSFTDVSAANGNLFEYGYLRWISGANSGLKFAIVRFADGLLWLGDALPEAAAIGDRAELYEGCNKSVAVCSGRFSNIVNFQGEPYLPGNDLLTRYPGA